MRKIGIKARITARYKRLVKHVAKCIPYFLARTWTKLKPPSLLAYIKRSRIYCPEVTRRLRQRKATERDVARLFGLAAKKRARLIPSSDPEQFSDWKQHALIEVDKLRSEIVDIKNREIASERFISGGAATVFIAYSKNLVGTPWILALVTVFAFFGLVRAREYQRNIFDLDCYLREIELIFRADGGWVSYFFGDRSMLKFFETRIVFWYGLLSLSFLLTVLAFAGVFVGEDLIVELR